MSSPVTVIDYGVGNLLSVSRAFEHWGARVFLANSVDKIIKADRLVLPGVGAFADGMAGLRAIGLVEPLRLFATTGRPFLGICLGMQMMLDASDEFGIHEGLGLIPGKVTAIPRRDVEGRPIKIPHIGWNRLERPDHLLDWEDGILKGIEPGDAVYFVHSFMAEPTNKRHRLADVTYHGQRIGAAIRSGSLYGCQFHPEKSGEIGLKIIRNFLDL